jgi:Gas vesicle synthesis protein GvpO
MAEEVREQAKRERADARERRRSLTTQPFEDADEAAGRENADGNTARATAMKAVGTAAAAAIVGGLAGGAKALIDRRRDSEPDPEDSGSEPADAAPESPEAEAEEEEDRDDDGEAAAEDTQGETDESEDEPTSRAGESEDEPVSGADGPGLGAEPAGPAEPSQGAATGEVAKIVQRAREQVVELLGSEAESISGIERANGSWSVAVEVVDLHRIPDTTDVFSSYEVVLDDDGNLVSLSRKRRYRRGQVEEGS